MATTTTTSISLSSPDIIPKLISKTTSSFSLTTSKQPLSPQRLIFSGKNTTPTWRIHATAAEVAPPLEAAPLETTQEIVSAAGDDGSSTAVSVLLFAAFVGLSLLTIGVVYIVVTDFLQKRESEKFQKEEEEAAKKKGGKKKKKVKARTGPRGFGQKIEEEDLDY